MLEIAIVIISLVQGVLAMLNKRINWLVYALQMVLLVIFSYYNHLYGDMFQNAAYFLICIAAWFIWKPGSYNEKISVLDKWERIWVSIMTVLGTVVLYIALKSTDDPLPFTDAFTTFTTIVALFLMSLHKIEAWVVWFVNDIAYMYQYFNLPDQAIWLFGLYVIWTAMAVASYGKWRKIYMGYDKEDSR